MDKSFILDIIEENASISNIYNYGKIVKDKSAMRELVREAQIVSEMGVHSLGMLTNFYKLNPDFSS